MTTGNNTKFYEAPSHPFQGERIAQESDLLSRYGLKNKEELWHAQSELRNLRREARCLLGETQDGVEEAGSLGAEFMAHMRRYGILSAEDDISQTLRLDVTDIPECRFQMVACRKGLAQTSQQACQFIVHGHVTADGTWTTVPSRKVEVDEEDTVAFDEMSKLTDELYPECAEA